MAPLQAVLSLRTTPVRILKMILLSPELDGFYDPKVLMSE